MKAGGFAEKRLLSRPSGTLSSIQNGGETPPDCVRAWRPVTGGSSHVAPVGNLLFRRLAVGLP